MSDSEEESYPLLGVPLEPIEEGTIPKKKPLNIQDQTATDKYGRRRFHGAFTGGFSAGHFNTVGTPGGWEPTAFKSSRSSKQEQKTQRPEDFMDDEDVDDFGIAPSVVRAKSQYSGSKGSKTRESVHFNQAPIVGEPVLRRILEPTNHTLGVLLLMKMGWKSGQGIGPRLSKMEKKLQKRRTKLVTKTQDPSSSSESDEELDMNVLFAPDDVEVTFANPRVNTFGMGYSGLDRSSVVSQGIDSALGTVPAVFRMLDNNKKLAIKGQAFGVGAFEREDGDIYQQDDMSQYDFALDTPASLKEKRRLQRANDEKRLAICGGTDVIEGFVPARQTAVEKKFYPPPRLPQDFQPHHTVRKSRFSEDLRAKSDVPETRRPALNAEDRSVLLGEAPSTGKRLSTVRQEDEVKPTEQIPQPKPDMPAVGITDNKFKPFLSEPEKQKRYEKYVQLVKQGNADSFKSVQPSDMSFWELERERTEFAQASKLYRPLSGEMADRFVQAKLPGESLDPLEPVAKMSHDGPLGMVEAAKSKMFGKLTRTEETWAPVALVCKRMNIAEPLNAGGKSLCEIAESKRSSKNSLGLFDSLVDYENPYKQEEAGPLSKPSSGSTKVDGKPPVAPEPLNEIFPVEKIAFSDPAQKKDLFKAIFCDSESETEAEPEPPPTKLSASGLKNIIRNTSPPRGLFANIDLNELNKKNVPLPPEPAPQPPVTETVPDITADVYGPALPEKPVFVRKPKPTAQPSGSSSEDEWVEKNEDSSSKKHKKKRHKKETRKKHKSHKKKHHREKK